MSVPRRLLTSQQTGTAPPSPVTPFTGSSIGPSGIVLAGASSSAASGRPGLILLAISVAALVGFAYWTMYK